jgi:hypothetical protein
MKRRCSISLVEQFPATGLSSIQALLWLAFTLFLLWGASTSMTEACMICIPYPKTTLADRLLHGTTVILARERVDKPYTFYTVDVLKGKMEKADFDAFINTTARRMLKQNPDDVVVFRRQNGEPNWLYTAYADFEYQEFIRAILKQSSRWNEFRGNRHRIDFFAQRLNHNDRQIWEQAYLEVGRAPYASIKRIAGIVPRRRIRAFLSNFQLIEWHNLYILMLGQSRHPDDVAYIRNTLIATAAYGIDKNLSAWVTAFIETNPDTGVEEIENMYFSNKRRTPGEIEAVCRGFSVLGSESGFRDATERIARRQRIVASYGTLLENHPLMAGPVAKDLISWQEPALVEQLAAIKEKESALDPDAKMAVTYYLLISQRF